MNNIVKQAIKKFLLNICQSEGIDPNDWDMDLENIHTIYVPRDEDIQYERQGWGYWERELYQHKIKNLVTGKIWTMTHGWNYNGSIYGCSSSELYWGDLECKIPIKNKFQPEFNNQPEFSFQR